MFDQMRIRYFLLAAFIVLIIATAAVGGDLEHPVKEVIFTYIFLGIFPIVWFGYQLKNQNILFSDVIQGEGLKNLKGPLTLIFISFFMLSIGIVWLNSVVISFFSPDLVEFFLADDDLLAKGRPIVSFFLAIYIALLAPLGEELVFRGLLLNRISYKLGRAYGIGLSSLLFAIFHFDVIGSFMTGVVLSLLYLWTKNLLYPILLHAANNTLAILLMIFNVEFPAFLSYVTVPEVFAASLPNLIIIVIFAPILIYLMYRYRDRFIKEKITP